MSPKQATGVGLLVGSTVGSFIPLLWGAGELSFSSIIFSAIGAIAGIWIAFQMTR